MLSLDNLCTKINQLCQLASSVNEVAYRITISGDHLNPEIASLLLEVKTEAEAIGSVGNIFANDDQLDNEDLEEPTAILNESWRLVLGKESIAVQLAARNLESTFLFFSEPRFKTWLLALDPFVQASQFDPDFTKLVTFRICGLQHSFGGEYLWVLPITDFVPTGFAISTLPESSEVLSLVHINSDQSLSINPKHWALNWGELDQEVAKVLIGLSAMILSACLVNELKRSSNKIIATIRGTKLITLNLTQTPNIKFQNLKDLISTVEWIYQERSETRLKLVADRLSIDLNPDSSLVDGLNEHLSGALQQAKDSYAFVILERKDAYHKEMRELMKDMKSQSDLYASKVRDLVAALTRDFLGILVFISFSVITKFDHKELKLLLSSGELSLLMKFMSGYLILSCLLQLITHWRDSSLSYDESHKWLKVMQNYTSMADHQERFINPLNKRRGTFIIAMVVSAFLYGVLAFLVWNLPCITSLLLDQ